MDEEAFFSSHKENSLNKYTDYGDSSSVFSGDYEEIITEIMSIDVTNWRQVIMLSIIFILGIITNGTVLIINWLSPVKQQRAFILVVNLAIADLIFLGSIPIKITNEIYLSEFKTGWIGCRVYACLRVNRELKFIIS